MDSRELIRQLLHEFASAQPAMSVQERTDSDDLVAVFDDETALVVKHDPKLDRVVIVGAIGKPPTENREQLYELLLQYNYMWTTDAGPRMALDGEPGQVAVLFELAVSSLSLPRISSVLRNLTAIQRAWMTLIRNLGAVPPMQFAGQQHGQQLVR